MFFQLGIIEMFLEQGALFFRHLHRKLLNIDGGKCGRYLGQKKIDQKAYKKEKRIGEMHTRFSAGSKHELQVGNIRLWSSFRSLSKGETVE